HLQQRSPLLLQPSPPPQITPPRTSLVAATNRSDGRLHRRIQGPGPRRHPVGRRLLRRLRPGGPGAQPRVRRRRRDAVPRRCARRLRCRLPLRRRSPLKRLPPSSPSMAFLPSTTTYRSIYLSLVIRSFVSFCPDLLLCVTR
uniref:Uncharacterized protein n=1 Tax=Triticum urartu TaxID=4572 RepID=A0A8R7PSQ4_TRIUA